MLPPRKRGYPFQMEELQNPHGYTDIKVDRGTQLEIPDRFLLYQILSKTVARSPTGAIPPILSQTYLIPQPASWSH